MFANCIHYCESFKSLEGDLSKDRVRRGFINGVSESTVDGSTLYVGLARAVSPTNTNFRLTFLLTRLQEALYEDLAV